MGDRRCLAHVEELIQKATADGAPVAGVICEPIQAEGGDNHASPAFFQALREICNKYDISLMMDEVQTGGGATGKMWCHQHFGIEADVVSFSKKMVSGGYSIIWNTDPPKVIMLEQVVKTIQEENLLQRVEAAGNTIMSGLTQLQSVFPHLLSKARGRGTFCAVDLPSVETRDTLLHTLRQRGVHLGGCGESSVRIRPSLTFTPQHANIMLDGLNDALREM